MYRLILLQTVFLSINCAPAGDVQVSVDQALPQVKSVANFQLSTNGFPDSGRKQAVLEQETPFSKKSSLYGQLQNFVAGFYNPKPIVDTIEEHDKYGNDGEKFRSVGTALVGGVEKISNFLNAAAELPFQVAKQVGKKVTASLNQVGGKLIGL